MKFLPLAILLFLASPSLAADSSKLAPADKARDMMGDVNVMAGEDDDKCAIVLFEDKVQLGYRLEVAENCAAAYPVMTKVKAWRVYKDHMISFVDAGGHDLIRFKGKGYRRFAVKSVDGIVSILSAQESAE